jgi:hypothetical protein
MLLSQTLKQILFLLFNITIINAYNVHLFKMSCTNNYLNSLSKHIPDYKLDISPYKINKIASLKTIKETEQPQIETSTIIFNMCAVKNVFFNRNSKNIIFYLKDSMDDLFIYEKDVPYKLSKETRICSTALNNFLFTPIRGHNKIDAIMYKDT